MASIEDLQAAVAAVSTAVTDLLAKVQADAAVVPDFQAEVDSLNSASAAIQGYLNPEPAPAADPAA